MLNRYKRFLSLTSIKPGASLQILSNRPYELYLNLQSLYDNRLANDASLRNVKKRLTTNIYAAITNYFVENVMSSFPEGAIVDENFINELGRAVFNRVLWGYGVLLYTNGNWESIESRFWWPILARGEKVGSGFVFPYQTDRQTFWNQQATATGGTIPDRARVSVLLDKVNVGTIRNFHYSGITLGNEIIEDRERVDGVCVAFGDGESMFDLIEPLVDQYNSLIEHTMDLIARFGSPHLQVPNSAIRVVNGHPTLNLDSKGAVLPKGPNDADYAYVTPTSEVQLFEFAGQNLLGLISAITAVPLSNFNIHGLPRMESGQGVQDLQAPATAKISLWRNDIVNAVKYAGLGEISWGDSVMNDPGYQDNPEFNTRGNEN